MLLFFIRHGKPNILNNNFYEAHLSEEGLRQAKLLALSNKLTRPDLLFSSPYNRAIETARVLCEVFDVKFEVRDFLKEWNLQSLSLLDPEYTVETQKGWADQRLSVRGGESLEELKKRAYEGTIQIVSGVTAEIVYFVSHGTLIEMLCSKIGTRQAVQSNVENMKFLDYAVLEFKDGALRMIKDINTL